MHNILKDSRSMDSIARQANYEGNESLLLFQRLSHSTIRGQLLNLLLDNERNHAARGHLEVIKEPPGADKDSGVNVNFRHVQYRPKSYDELELELAERLNAVKVSTPVELSNKAPRSNSYLNGREIIPIAFRPRGEKPSTNYMSAAEAHEKGHYVRPYSGRFFDSYFAPALDPAAIRYDENDLSWLRHNTPNVADDVIIKSTTAYLMQAGEIAERMSQLKNYFGMKGNEIFTADHLVYAREHYVADTGIDNAMNLFFEAITPKTQREFLRLINNSGI